MFSEINNLVTDQLVNRNTSKYLLRVVFAHFPSMPISTVRYTFLQVPSESRASAIIQNTAGRDSNVPIYIYIYIYKYIYIYIHISATMPSWHVVECPKAHDCWTVGLIGSRDPPTPGLHNPAQPCATFFKIISVHVY